MEKEEFIELIKRLNPDLATYWDNGLSLPRAVLDTAVYCFIHSLTGKDVEEVRKQLITLNKDGFFNFKKGTGN